jgi:DNA repair exonuclease SbcCD nuclease subunit
MRFRLVHTSDVHLDACFAAPGMPPGFGNQRRQSLRDVFHRIVVRAGEWPADALLIGGDLFELERVTRDTVAFLRREFERIPNVPVFICAGNHDPATPESPYVRESWPGNVTIFGKPVWESRPLERLPLTIHGFGFDGPDVSVNPFGSLEVPQDNRTHVAVAHGSERGHQPPGKDSYAPFDANEAAPEGLAYLALGHFHAVTHIETSSSSCVYYSGAPEGLAFSETGQRHYLEVEIDEEGVRVNRTPSSNMVYGANAIDCSSFDTTQQLVDEIRSLPDAKGTDLIARITLTGTCGSAVREGLDAVYDAVAPQFAFLELVDETTPGEDYETLAHEPTSLGAFLERLNEAVSDAPDEDRRAVLLRARTIGLAAYRGHELPIPGVGKEAQ